MTSSLHSIGSVYYHDETPGYSSGSIKYFIGRYLVGSTLGNFVKVPIIMSAQIIPVHLKTSKKVCFYCLNQIITITYQIFIEYLH